VVWLGWQLYSRPLKPASFANPATIKAVESSKTYQEF